MALDFLDEEALKTRLQEAFDNVDADGDGKISHDDLKTVLQEAGFEGNDDNIQAIISAVDDSGDGLINFEEFAIAVISLGITIRIAMFLRRMFNQLDVDGSGYLEPSDIKALVSDAGLQDRLSEDDIDAMFEAADTSGDGKVSFEEFCDRVCDRFAEAIDD